MNKKEYDEGYNSAIEAIKKALQGGGSGSQGGDQSDPDLNTTINPSNNDGPLSQKAGGSSNNVQQPEQQGALGGEGVPGGSTSSDASKQARKGEVGGFGGSFIDPKTGEQIAKESGYDASEAGSGSSMTDVEQKWGKIGKQVQQAVAARGSGMGSALAEALGKMYKAKFNWKQELRKIIGSACGGINTDSRWGRKRDLALTGELRKYDREQDSNLSDVVFMIDTSQSNLGNLEVLVSESLHILKQKSIETCTYVPYDYDVQDILNVSTRKPIELKSLLGNLRGGGGTSFERSLDSFGNGFKNRRMDIYGKTYRIKRNGPKCQLLVCFTDGEDSFNDIARNKPSWVKNLIFVVANRSESSGAKALRDAGYKVLFIDSNDIK